MKPIRSIASPRFLVVAVLAGCSPPPGTTTVRPQPEPDCSFRSATTCWTLATRFPKHRAQAPDSVPGELLSRPPLIVAKAADSAAQP